MFSHSPRGRHRLAARALAWVAFSLALLATVFGASALASTNVDPVGTWTSTALVGGTSSFAHTTTITTFDPTTGAFAGTDSNGPLTGTVHGASFQYTAGGGGYSYTLTGTINGNTWTGTWHDSNGVSGTWSGHRTSGAPPPVKGASSPAAVNPRVSSIASSLPTMSQAFKPLSSDVVNAAITIGLALFLTFPSNLFNSTFEENYADIRAWWERWLDRLVPGPVRRSARSSWDSLTGRFLEPAAAEGEKGGAGRPDGAGTPEDARPAVGGTASRGWDREKATFVVVLLAGALLGSFLDPAFGFNFRTVLTFVSIVVAMGFGVFLGGLVTGAYHRARKHGRVPYKFEALPGGLVVAAACVIISRGTGFAPGYLYGVVCGVSFARKLAKNEEGHLVALGAVAKIVLALVAWAFFASVTHAASKPGSFFGTVLLDDFLASLFVSSLVGTTLSLFPVKFMPGHKLHQWHKGVWALTFGVTLFLLVQALLRPHSGTSGHSHVPLATTAALFIAFAGGSLLFRDHFARKKRHLAAAPEGTVTLDGESTGPAAAPSEAAGPA
jgi:hypothetical protein